MTNYIARQLLDAANQFPKALDTNIFEEVFGCPELDRENCTDYRAVFTDGSMLVLSGDRWECEMFDASGDELDEEVS
jgi:hypothetical protein